MNGRNLVNLSFGLMLLTIGVGAAIKLVRAQVITSFSVRYTVNAKGDIAAIGNTLLTCPPGSSCTSALAGSGTSTNNNDHAMIFVDVDGDGTTFNSSTATLSLPAGAAVLFAGLYWGADTSAGSGGSAAPTPASLLQVRFRTPTAAAYTTLTGTQIGAQSVSGGSRYLAFSNVTTAVQAAGSGIYTVANVQAGRGQDRYAGWTMVIVYTDPAEPPRNLTVFNGYAVVSTSTPNVSIPVSGFLTPPAGSVNTRLGTISFEGDLGFTGDSLRLNSTFITNALNPSTNYFNSSISRLGARISAKNPDYVNNLGFDIDVVDASGILANNATSATINLVSTSETYFPAVVTFATELYAPNINIVKGGTNVTRTGQTLPGDIIQYTVTVSNTGQDNATNVVLTDVIPTNTTYVPGTLVVTSGANAGTKSDTSGNDQAEFDSANNRVVFRLGTGANAATGGSLAPTASTAITFRVQVNANAPAGAIIPNQANVTATGASLGQELTQNSNIITFDVASADLSLAKTSNVLNPPNGSNFTYTLTLNNAGTSGATGVVVSDPIPTGTTFVSATASQGSYNNVNGVWTVGSVASGSAATLQITVNRTSMSAITNSAQVTASNQPDPDSTPNNGIGNGEDDQVSFSTAQVQADLSLNKTASAATPNVGSAVTFTVTVSNAGPNAATNVRVTDRLPTGLTFVSATPSQGTYTAATGVWAVGTVANAGSATLMLTATVAEAGAIINTAEITASDQFDPDSTPNNNNAGEDDQRSVTVTGQQADLSLSKTPTDASPSIGDNLNFTITITNAGPSTATGVTVIDQIPTGTSFISATPSLGTYNSGTGVWTVGTLPSGSSATLALTVVIQTSNPITNVAQVATSNQPDPDSTPGNGFVPGEDDSVSVSTQQGTADLSLTKTASTAAPNVGAQISFTVTVTNGGPNTATNVMVSDPLDAQFGFISAVASQGAYNPTSGLWNVGSIPNGGSATLTITGTVNGPNSFTNTAQVSASDQRDPNSTPNNGIPSENDQSSVVITPQRADLSISKSSSTATPNVGNNITFTVTVTNAGPNGATNVAVRDLIPVGTSFVSATTTHGTYDSGTGQWTVGGITSGGSAILQVTVLVNAAGTITNTAEVIASDQFDPDSTPNNNNIAEDDQVSVSVSGQQADLSLTKVASTPTPNVGSNVTFTITVTNGGPNPATNVSVFDQLPAELTFVSATPSQGTFISTSGLWTVGSITNGGNATLQIVATVNSPGAIINTAQIAGSDQFDPDSTPNNNNAGEDDQSSSTVTGQQADLSVAKSVSNPNPNTGTNITFTVTVNNDGPSTATNVVVRDLVPAGTTFVSATPSRGNYVQGSGLWSFPTLGSGVTATLMITVTVNTAAPITNTAEIIAVDQFDPDSTPNNNVPAEDDQTSIMTQQGTADLSLTKTVNNAHPNVGNTITFTVSVSNAGPNTSTNLSVIDQLPAGLSFVNAVPSQGTYNSATGIWDIGSLPSGATATLLQLAALVEGADPVVNKAEVYTSDQFDPNSTPNNNNPAENDQDSVLITPQRADLSIAKAVNNPNPNIGNSIIFTITVSNAGPDAATDIVVRDLVPSGTTFVSASASRGTYDSVTGLWTIDGITSSGSAVLMITVTVNTAAAITNTAEIIAVDQFDPDSTPNNNILSEDDQATVMTQQGTSDLSLTKIANTLTPNVGANVTFTITVTNGGPNTATGVEVVDQLPSGLTFVSATPSQGTYNPTDGLWTVGSILNAGTATLQITATVTQPGEIANTAQVAAVNQFDGDSTPNNNVEAEDDQETRIITGQQADLSLAKSVSNPNPNTGTNITFTISLTNFGPSTATGIVVADPIPAGTTFVSAVPARGTYDQVTGIWNVGMLGDGVTTTLQITVQVNTAAAITNTAQVTASDQFDPDSTPNNGTNNDEDDRASVSTQQGTADLSLSKTVNNANPNVGNTITFTVSVSNAGPNTSTNLSVLDLLPPGLAFVNAVPSLGTYDSTTGIWDIGSLPSGATATLLQLAALVEGADPTVNRAEVYTSDQFDPNSTPNNNNPAENDQDSVLVTPQRADLSIAKGVNNPNPNIGNNIIFTVTLNNVGPDAATNIVVRDLVPPGTTFVSSTASVGAYDSGTGLWSVPALANNASATLQITVTVNTAAPITNRAEIIAVDQFDPDSTPNNDILAEDDEASVTTQQGTSDLSLTKIAGNATPSVNTNVTFTVTVSNGGGNTATGVEVIDQLPDGLTFVSATPSQGTYNPTNGIWAIGSILSGGNATLQLTATVTQAGAIINTAQVSAADQFDPDSTPNNNNAGEDDQASSTVTGQQADLSLAKTVSNPNPNNGDTITFTVTISNAGPNSATNIVVLDPVPMNTTFGSATPSQGSYTQANGQWAVGTLASGASATLMMTVTVNTALAVTNTAQVMAVDQFDPDSTPNNNVATEDDQTSVSTEQGTSDLSLTKTASNPSPNVNDIITFTVTVSNGGINDALNVEVIDQLPAGLEFVSATPGQGTYNEATGLWAIGTIPNGASRVLQLAARVTTTGALVNTAQVVAVDQFDPDSTPNNNNAGEDDQASSTVTVQQSNLALTKTVNTPNPSVGSNVTFTITLTNSGPNPATNVTVLDLLPAGLEFVSATPSQGTYSSATGLWTVGNVALSTPLTLQIVAEVNSAEPIINTAEVRAADQFDPNSTPNNNDPTENDQASATVDGVQADLSLVKSANTSTGVIGTSITFTLLVTNSGPDTATGVVVQDQLPAGITFVSSPTCTNAAGLVTCNIASIPPDESASVTINTQVTANGIFVNQAQITASGIADPDSTPNNGFGNGEDDQSSFTITALQADLAINKTNNTNGVLFNGPVQYTITITNAGPSSVTDIVVIDQVPIEIGNVTWTCTASPGSTCGAASGPGNINTPIDILNGGTVTFTLNGIVDGRANGNLINTARLQLPEGVTDGNLGNNSSTDTDNIDQGTAIEYAGGSAVKVRGGAVITWKTGFESDNLGFHVFRDRNGERTQITPQLIAGSALLVGPGLNLSAGYSYVWRDQGADLDAQVQYWIQEFAVSGEKFWHGPITLNTSDQGPATTDAKPSAILSDLNASAEALHSDGDRELLAAAAPSISTELLPSLPARSAVKIGVRQEGWYRITGAQLQAAGLPLDGDARRLQLYVDGQKVASRVTGDEDGRLDPQDTIEFYGLGLDTPSTDLRVYWLAYSGEPGLRVESAELQGGGTAGANFPATVERRDRLTYFSSLRNGEAENFFGAIFDSSPIQQKLTLRKVDLAEAGDALLEVRLQGASNNSHFVRISINGQELAPLSFEGRNQGIAQLQFPHSLLREGENIITLQSGAQNDISFVDRIRLTYRRLFTADNDRLTLRVPANSLVTIGDFSGPQIRVFDVTEPKEVRELRGQIRSESGRSSIQLTVGGAGERRLIAFAGDEVDAVASLRLNNPSTLRRPVADLIVISHERFKESLRPLIEARRKQGLQVQIVDVEDIYDQYNFGHKSPAAIKQYLSALASLARTDQRLPEKQYLLLVGDATADPRNYLGWGEFDLVPTHLFDTAQLETSSDDWFVDFDNDGLPELSVGRLPARMAAEAAQMITKIISYDAKPPGREVALVADVNDTFDFEAAADQLAVGIGGAGDVQKIYRARLGDAEARKQLLDSLRRGPKLINYVGHGSTNIWRSNLLTGDDAGQLVDSTQTSLLVSMTCLNGFFQDPAVASLAENLIKAQGGAVAAWASSGFTGPSAQAEMNKALIQELFGGSVVTIGDATRKAKAAVANQDVRRSWILFGDPTTRLR